MDKDAPLISWAASLHKNFVNSPIDSGLMAFKEGYFSCNSLTSAFSKVIYQLINVNTNHLSVSNILDLLLDQLSHHESRAYCIATNVCADQLQGSGLRETDHPMFRCHICTLIYGCHQPYIKCDEIPCALAMLMIRPHLSCRMLGMECFVV